MGAIVKLAGLLIFCLCGIVSCDIPANCTYEDIQGEWLFFEGERESDSSIDCKNYTEMSKFHFVLFRLDSSENPGGGPGPFGPPLWAPMGVFKISLRFPDLAVDEYGDKGHWTIVYNQGFEVVINYRKYFAFSMYEEQSNGTAISYCDLTMNGWSHDVLGKNWACYYGEKLSNTSQPKVHNHDEHENLMGMLRYPELYASLINQIQKSWEAMVYPELSTMTYNDLLLKAGGLGSRMYSSPQPTPLQPTLKKHLSQLPEGFDWRNVNGINYVSPVRNQGACGSCYAFSSLGMLESRLRIMTNNSLQVVFSPQDIVSCSEYSQGCLGGFPYVTAGKYGQDFGLVTEECYPYEGQTGTCSTKACKRYYVAEYNYVGGFFGGCNEELMKLDLVQNGPLTVAMEVYDDLMLYKGGIYHHTNVDVGFNPFRLVNHGVLIVGYGVSGDSAEKYWIVKNSWGEGWGEGGYFRIRRGNNECNIESMAVSAKPIP